MTVVALLADPPRPGLVLTDLAESAPIDREEAADLYAALLSDAMRAVERSGGDLLVNYRPDDLLPVEGEESAERELRELAGSVLENPDEARFEVQVGSTEAARVGNTVTHLLEREGADTAAVLRPEAPLVDRTDVDGVAMDLRRNDVALGPTSEGDVYFAGFAEPIDFEGAFAEPALQTLTDRARDAGHDVSVRELQPLVGAGTGLLTTVTLLRAMRTAGERVPPATAGVIEELGLRRGPDGRLRRPDE